jgi:hypothetical protein
MPWILTWPAAELQPLPTLNPTPKSLTCGSAVTAGRLLLVSEGPSPVFGVADRFVRGWAELESTQGLIYGLAGTPGRLSDWSPQGRAQVTER